MAQVTFNEALGLLSALDHSDDLTLIGGQALSAWVNTFAIDDGFTTKDLDFQAGSPRQRIHEIAQLWGAAVVFPSPDHATPVLAVLILDRPDEEPLQVDLLTAPHGIDPREIIKHRVELKTEDGRHRFFVVHPVHLLEGLLANHKDLPAYRDEVTRERIKVACSVVKEWIKAKAVNEPKDAYEAIEMVAHLARGTAAVELHVDHGIDILSSLPERGEAALNPAFFEKRRPQIIEAVERKRQAHHNRLANTVLRPRRR